MFSACFFLSNEIIWCNSGIVVVLEGISVDRTTTWQEFIGEFRWWNIDWTSVVTSQVWKANRVNHDNWELTEINCISSQVDQIDGEPTGAEYDDHGDQHLVNPTVPGGLLLPLFGRPGARHTPGSLVESDHDLGVADHDGGEGQHELGDVGEGPVDELWDSLPGLLGEISQY